MASERGCKITSFDSSFLIKKSKDLEGEGTQEQSPEEEKETRTIQKLIFWQGILINQRGIKNEGRILESRIRRRNARLVFVLIDRF